jgi:Flp pilus assembly protein TadG
MTIHMPRHLSKARFLGRLLRDNRGVAAVEFAIILPLMLTVYLGTAELTQGLITTRKSTSVASALSDLVAEQAAGATLTDAEIADVFAAANAILSPYSTTSLKMTVSSVEFVTDAKVTTGFDAKIRWTITSNGGTARPCQIMTSVANNSNPSPTTIPTGIYPVSGSAQATAIVGDATYTYTSAFGSSVLAWSTTATSLTFKHTSYMRPRNQYAITYSGSTGKVCASY